MSKTQLTRRRFVAAFLTAFAAGCGRKTVDSSPDSSLSRPTRSIRDVQTKVSPVFEKPDRIWQLLPDDAKAILEKEELSIDDLDEFQPDSTTWLVSTAGDSATVVVREEWTGNCYARYSDAGFLIDLAPSVDEKQAQRFTGHPSDVASIVDLCKWLNRSPENYLVVRGVESEELPLSAIAGIPSDPSCWTSAQIELAVESDGVCALSIKARGQSFPVTFKLSDECSPMAITKIGGQDPKSFVKMYLRG